MLNDWVASTTLKNAQFARVANDALGSVRLHATQLANLRHGLAKSISPYAFDALGALNAAACAKHCGDKAFEHTNPRLERDIAYVRPLLNSDGTAVSTQQLMAQFLGLAACVEPPEMLAKPAPKFDADSLLVQNIGGIILAELLKTSPDKISAVTQAIIHYPSKDAEKLDRLKQVILGEDYFDEEELEDALPALRLMLQDLTEERWSIERLLDLAKTATPSSNQ